MVISLQYGTGRRLQDLRFHCRKEGVEKNSALANNNGMQYLDVKEFHMKKLTVSVDFINRRLRQRKTFLRL